MQGFANRRLAELDVIKKMVEAYQVREHEVRERKQSLGAVQAPGVADLQLTGLAPAPDAPGSWVARYTIDDNRSARRDPATDGVLMPGSPFHDGVVKSIGSDHVIVETVTSVANKPARKRLLRFSPPQPAPRVALREDTTRITAPLLSSRPGRPTSLVDDAPDYYGWLERRHGAGVTRENNASAPLDKAISGLTGAGKTFFDEMLARRELWRVLSTPWREQDCPPCVQRLEANERPLTAIAQAVLRPRYFEAAPAWSRASDTRIPSLLRLRHAANALAGRGLLRISRGDAQAAAEDALAGQRLAVLTSQGPSFIEKHIGLALRGISAPLLPLISCQASLTRGDALGLLRLVGGLSPLSTPAEALDEYERFHALDQALIIRSLAAERGPGAMILQLEPAWLEQTGQSLELDPVVYLIPVALVDWDEVLRLINRRFDALVAVHRAANTSERHRARDSVAQFTRQHEERRHAALEKLHKASNPADVARAAESMLKTPEGRVDMAHVYLSDEPLTNQDSPWGYTIAANEADALFRMSAIALALAVHKRDAAAFPDALEAVDALLPGPLARSTPLSGYVLKYLGGGAEFLITAVPEEPKLTGNRGFCLDATGAVRITLDGTAPPSANGRCDPKAALLR
jgi:hypothetical protein